MSSTDLDVRGVDFSQQDLLRFQGAQLAQLFLQAHVLLIHVETEPVPNRSGAVQLNNFQSKQVVSESTVFECNV